MAHNGDFVEAELRVGMLDVALAKLISADHHTIEFPTLLLPENVVAGSIVRLQCSRAAEAEFEDAQKFDAVQKKILDTFATNLPKAPVLRARNITQTSVVLEWDQIDIASADMHSMAIYKGDQRLGLIPSPLKRSVTKVSNLEIDQPYNFHLVLSTSAGDFESNKLHVQTHKMTDLSGVVVCIGSLAGSTLSKADLEQILKRLGGKPPQETVKLETTHFICTTETGPQCQRALEFNIPVVRPEWLKACETERRLVSVRSYYLSADGSYSHQNYQASLEESAKEENAKEEQKGDVKEEKDEYPKGENEEDSKGQKEDPAKEDPEEEAPKEEPVKEAPLEEAPIEEASLKEVPIEQGAVKEESVEPVKEDLVGEEPTDQPADQPATDQPEELHRTDSQGDLSVAIEDVASSHESSFHGSVQVSDGVYEESMPETPTESSSIMEAVTDSDQQQNEQYQDQQQDLEQKLKVDPEAHLNPSEEHEVVVKEGGALEPLSASVAYQSEDGKETVEGTADIGNETNNEEPSNAERQEEPSREEPVSADVSTELANESDHGEPNEEPTDQTESKPDAGDSSSKSKKKKNKKNKKK